MKRRVNYTGRQRIPRENIEINLVRDDDIIRSFDAIISFDDFDFPDDAKVYIDAYHRTEFLRFNFGTVDDRENPRSTALSSLAYGANLKFRLLVVDESGKHGLILGQADRISPEKEADRKSILPVDWKDLGKQIWRIEYTEHEGGPILYFNGKIPNIKNISMSDPQFFICVYPSVIREVLTHIVFVDGVDSPSEPSIDWHADWIRFARIILPGREHPEILDPGVEDFNSEDAKKWIDDVVEEFCDSRKEWDKYISQIRGAGE